MGCRIPIGEEAVRSGVSGAADRILYLVQRPACSIVWCVWRGARRASSDQTRLCQPQLGGRLIEVEGSSSPARPCLIKSRETGSCGAAPRGAASARGQGVSRRPPPHGSHLSPIVLHTETHRSRASGGAAVGRWTIGQSDSHPGSFKLFICVHEVASSSTSCAKLSLRRPLPAMEETVLH